MVLAGNTCMLRVGDEVALGCDAHLPFLAVSENQVTLGLESAVPARRLRRSEG
jgi:hypothetical protein